MKWSEIGKSPMTSAASQGADPNDPNGDDRRLAAAAHLSNVVGMFFAAPAAIFVLRRKDSSFVAFHALQAAIVSILMIGLAFVLLAVLVIGQFWVDRPGRTGAEALGIVAVFLLVCLVTLGLPWLWSIIAALKAWGGRHYSIPIAGTIAARFLARDAQRPRGRGPQRDQSSTSNSSGPQ